MKRCGIYLLTHMPSGRRYVGQSLDIEARWRQHETGKNPHGHIAKAIAKHGWQSFSTEVLELCSREDLNAAEARWINKLGTLEPSGFNLTSGGGQFEFSADTRARISERTKAGLTPEVIASRAAKLRGVPKSQAHKLAIGAAQTNERNRAHCLSLARNQSAETRRKIAEAHAGMRMSDQAKAKLSNLRKADAANTERLALMSRNMSAETKAKMSASAKARCAREKAAMESMT